MLIGQIFKSDTSPFWLAEAPIIGVFTQGEDRAEAEEMLIDAVQEVVHRDGFTVTLSRQAGDDVLITASDPAALAAYVLKYQRETNGLSLSDVAKKLGTSSRNAYASYEQGKREPSLSKFVELLAVVAPDLALIVGARKPTAERKPAAKIAVDGKRVIVDGKIVVDGKKAKAAMKAVLTRPKIQFTDFSNRGFRRQPAPVTTKKPKPATTHVVPARGKVAR